MTDPQLGVFMLILFVGLIMLGFPIAFTLIAMGVGFAWLAFDGNWEPVMSLLVQRTWSVMTNDVLISVPLFVFMGYIVERANILDRLFRSVQLAAGILPWRWPRWLPAPCLPPPPALLALWSPSWGSLPSRQCSSRAMTSGFRPALFVPAAASAFLFRRVSCLYFMEPRQVSRQYNSMRARFSQA